MNQRLSTQSLFGALLLWPLTKRKFRPEPNGCWLTTRHRSPRSSPSEGGSCSAIRRRFNALDCFTAMVRDLPFLVPGRSRYRKLVHNQASKMP